MSEEEEQSDEEEEEEEEEEEDEEVEEVYVICPHTGDAYQEDWLREKDPTFEAGGAPWKRRKGDQGENEGKRGTVGESEAIDLASEVRLCPPITPCDLSCLPLLFIMFAVVAAVCCF